MLRPCAAKNARGVGRSCAGRLSAEKTVRGQAVRVQVPYIDSTCALARICHLSLIRIYYFPRCNITKECFIFLNQFLENKTQLEKVDLNFSQPFNDSNKFGKAQVVNLIDLLLAQK